MAAGAGTGVAPALAILTVHALLSAYTYALVGRTVGATGPERCVAAIPRRASRGSLCYVRE